jgi:hypothetical protein
MCLNQIHIITSDTYMTFQIQNILLYIIHYFTSKPSDHSLLYNVRLSICYLVKYLHLFHFHTPQSQVHTSSTWPFFLVKCLRLCKSNSLSPTLKVYRNAHYCVT